MPKTRCRETRWAHPQLPVTHNPKMLPRLDEIEDDLLARAPALSARLGAVEGIDLTLTFLRQYGEG